MPADVVAKVVGDRQTVAADAPVFQGRDRRRQDRNVFPSRIGRDQRVENEALGDRLELLRREQRVERIGRAAHRRPQNVGDRPRMPARTTGSARADARAGGEQREGHDRQRRVR